MTFSEINALAKKREPFLFISDFKAQKIKVILLKDLEKEDIAFEIKQDYLKKKHPHTLQKYPISFKEYEKQFDKIIEHIKDGNTYLLNLTTQTKIETTLCLKEIYSLANAKYKIRYKDDFVCFSPEGFVKIDKNKIHTYPMKGTISASTPDAQKKILADKKEMAEHIMVVDLLRNDLSIKAKNVRVEEFRYITKIDAGEQELLQVSSHISGDLEENWHEQLGDILQSLLPAGSISGTPKKSTLEIIEEVETYERGYFSGVFGVYDGESFESGVMIRFIQNSPDGYIYKSGGGITLDSDVKREYQEMLDKVYLP